MRTKNGADEIVERYLSHLEAALRDLPTTRRREIIEEITDHISDGRAELNPGDEVGLRSLLDRVGNPEMIAAEAGVGELPRRGRPGDAWVPLLLLFGGFVFLAGWFVGLAMLWLSDTWRVRDKLLGTLVVPAGLLGVVVLLLRVHWSSSTSCPSQNAITHCVTNGSTHPPLVLFLVYLAAILALVVAVHLERVRRNA